MRAGRIPLSSGKLSSSRYSRRDDRAHCQRSPNDGGILPKKQPTQQCDAYSGGKSGDDGKVINLHGSSFPFAAGRRYGRPQSRIDTGGCVGSLAISGLSRRAIGSFASTKAP